MLNENIQIWAGLRNVREEDIKKKEDFSFMCLNTFWTKASQEAL